MDTIINNITIEKQLSQIADMLLLNGMLTEHSGLIYGKMGIAVFFFHYAKYTGNMLFADYALDLIGEIQSQIHINSPADYGKGIAGIGVGIDYLIRNDFLIVEDDICEGFDQRMIRAVMYDPWQDFSMYEGLTGYGRYWISRLPYQTPSACARECLWRIVEWINERFQDIPQNEQIDVYSFLLNLQEISGYESCGKLLQQCQKWEFHCFGGSTIECVAREIQCNRHFNETSRDEMDSILQQLPDLDLEKPPTSMGLLRGYAGQGLLRLSVLDAVHSSWMELL